MGKKGTEGIIIDYLHQSGVVESDHVSPYTSNYEQQINHRDFSVGGRHPFADLAGRRMPNRAVSPVEFHVSGRTGATRQSRDVFEANSRPQRERVSNLRYPAMQSQEGVVPTGRDGQDEEGQCQGALPVDQAVSKVSG